MAMQLAKKVVKCLESSPERRFTAKEIAEWVFKNYPKECEEKRARAKVENMTDDLLINQLYAEIGAQRPTIEKNNPNIKTTADHPRKYYFTELTEDQEIERAEDHSVSPASPKQSQGTSKTEHELYPKLSDFLSSELQIFSMQIDERKSPKKQGPGGNEWLFPDVVAMQDLSKNWHTEIKGIVKQYGDKKTKLWSFEVKIRINRSNVRSSFFQTVSNSSWANFGYLVANEIETNAMAELRMLASLHGIGFIKLDAENPSESQIIIPARERVDIDWDAANRLATESTDFNKYIELVRQFYQADRLEKSDWKPKKS